MVLLLFDKNNNQLKFGFQEAAEAALRTYEAEVDKIRQKEDRPPASTTQQQIRDKVRFSGELSSMVFKCYYCQLQPLLYCVISSQHCKHSEPSRMNSNLFYTFKILSL